MRIGPRQRERFPWIFPSTPFGLIVKRTSYFSVALLGLITMEYFSDEELVRLYLKNEGAHYLEQIYIRYRTLVYNKCLSFSKDPVEAQDMAQDAFLKLMGKLGTFRGEAKFSTWLHIVILNFCRNQSQTKRNSQKLFLDCNWEQLDMASDDTAAEQAEQAAQQLEWSLQQLSSLEQRVLRMKYEDKISVREIALLNGLTESAVKMRLKRCRDKLRIMYAAHV
ncbi:RNA polymerase sigma factor [Spirosoma jeollabukense]